MSPGIVCLGSDQRALSRARLHHSHDGDPSDKHGRVHYDLEGA